MSRSVEKSGEKPSLAVLVAPHVCAGVPQLMVMGVTRAVAPSPPLRQTGGIFKGLFSFLCLLPACLQRPARSS